MGRRRRAAADDASVALAALPEGVIQCVLLARLTLLDLSRFAGTCRRWRAACAVRAGVVQRAIIATLPIAIVELRTDQPSSRDDAELPSIRVASPGFSHLVALRYLPDERQLLTGSRGLTVVGAGDAPGVPTMTTIDALLRDHAIGDARWASAVSICGARAVFVRAWHWRITDDDGSAAAWAPPPIALDEQTMMFRNVANLLPIAAVRHEAFAGIATFDMGCRWRRLLRALNTLCHDQITYGVDDHTDDEFAAALRTLLTTTPDGDAWFVDRLVARFLAEARRDARMFPV